MTRARLVLVALLGVLLSCTPNAEPDTSEADPPTYPRVVGLETACPSPEQQPNLPDGLLPTGATQVRLCNLEGDRYFIGRNKKVEDDFDVPLDALTTGIDELLSAVNDQEVTDDLLCGGVGSPTMVLWFSYPDADYAVTYNAGGCGTLDRGDGAIMGADEVQHVFSDLLWSQRSHAAPPPASHEMPSCQPTSQVQTPLLMTEHLVIDRAVWCELILTARSGWRPARLTRGQVAELNEGFTTEESVGGPCRGRPRLSGALNVTSAWGDQVTLRATCQDLHVPVPFGDPERVWPLSDGLRTMFAILPLGRPLKNVPYDPDQVRPVE